jgi:hypothetical protein
MLKGVILLLSFFEGLHTPMSGLGFRILLILAIGLGSLLLLGLVRLVFLWLKRLMLDPHVSLLLLHWIKQKYGLN